MATGFNPRKEREHYLENSDLALMAGPRDPFEYRMGMFDALAAAQWCAHVDSEDRQIRTQLLRAARFTVATAASMTSTEDRAIVIDDELRPIRPGLPDGALTSTQYVTGLWAATAAGDFRSAAYLSSLDLSILTTDTSEDVMATAALLRGLWAGTPGGAARLITALEATDPNGASTSEANRLLLLSVPLLRVFDALLERQLDTASQHLSAAAEDHLAYWAPNRGQRDAALSLELTGLFTILRSQGALVEPVDGCIPLGATATHAVVAACPICASAVEARDQQCWRCARDLSTDALLELPTSALFQSAVPCNSCGSNMGTQAIRCWSCDTPAT